MNPIEIQLKRKAKRLGYRLRRIPTNDPWYLSIGPYYMVNRSSNRVYYKRLGLHEVFGILTTIQPPNKK